MKERLYNENGRANEKGREVEREFEKLIYSFMREKLKLYDVRDLNGILNNTIYDDVLNEILGI